MPKITDWKIDIFILENSFVYGGIGKLDFLNKNR